MENLDVDVAHLRYVQDQHIKTVREHPDKMWNRWTYQGVEASTGLRKRVVKRYVHCFDAQSNTLPLYRGTKTPKTSDLDIFRGVVVYWNAPKSTSRQLRPRQSDWVTTVTFHIPLPVENVTAAKPASTQQKRVKPLKRAIVQPRRLPHANNSTRRLRRGNTSLIVRCHSLARVDSVVSVTVPANTAPRVSEVVEMRTESLSPEINDVQMTSVDEDKGSYLAPLKRLFGFFAY